MHMVGCTVTQADQVVYATRSNLESENGAVVRRVLEHYKESFEGSCKPPRFHLKRCTQSKEEEGQCYYIALVEAKVCHVVKIFHLVYMYVHLHPQKN